MPWSSSRSRHDHLDSSVAPDRVVQRINRGLGVLRVAHFDKAEAARFARDFSRPVRRDERLLDDAELLETRDQLLTRDAGVHSGYKNVDHETPQA